MNREEKNQLEWLKGELALLRNLLRGQEVRISNQAAAFLEIRRDIESRRENNFGLYRRNVRLTIALEAIANGEPADYAEASELARAALANSTGQTGA